MVLMKNVITSLAKSVLMPLRSTAATWAADEGTHKKNVRIKYDNNNNFKQRNGWCYENS